PDGTDRVLAGPAPRQRAQPPGGARVAPLLPVVGAPGDDVVAIEAAAQPCDVGKEHGQLPGGQADGEDAVERGRPADRAAAHALGRTPDRHRRLRWWRKEGHRVQPVMGPFVADRGSPPRTAQDLQPFVEHVAADLWVGLLAEGPELRARADAE